MAERKTQENNTCVRDFIDNVKNEKRRKDSQVILKMMRSISGKRPKMWGPSIVGFGKHYYKYANGKDAEICKIGFSPRAQSLVFYLCNFKERTKLLNSLGKHKTSSGGCLYINKLEDIDLNFLETIIENAYRHKE
ncbi:MAG: DUF1801 domain-containing protein [Gammaproteobacteria bacterium]